MPSDETRPKPFPEAASPALLARPLDYIVAEHARLRAICDRLDAIVAEGRIDAGEAEALAVFLDRDFRLHVIDEEEDLFPLLRWRCKPDDEIGRALGTLAADHAADEQLGERVMAALRARDSDGMLAEDREALAAFAAHQRDHLAFENAVVLPIARRRLSARDQRALASRMAARRGITRIEDIES